MGGRAGGLCGLGQWVAHAEGVGSAPDVSERGSVHSRVSDSRTKRVSRRVAKPSSRVWRRSAMRCVTAAKLMSRDEVGRVWRRSAYGSVICIS